MHVPVRKRAFSLSPIPLDKSVVYVFRRTTPMNLFGASSCPRPVAVALDGQYRSELKDETYIALSVEPGAHTVSADPLPPYRYVDEGTAFRIAPAQRRPASIKVDALADRAYFVELACTTGSGSYDSSLESMPEDIALPVVKHFHHAW